MRGGLCEAPGLDRFAMPNLIAGREVVRELVQDNFTAENVAAEVSALLEDGPRRGQVVKGLAEVRTHLQSGRTDETAAQRAARAVLSVARWKD